MKDWRQILTDAGGYEKNASAMSTFTAREVVDEIERLQALLKEAATHLRLHAEEYEHPGQFDLISRIEGQLSRN